MKAAHLLLCLLAFGLSTGADARTLNFETQEFRTGLEQAASAFFEQMRARAREWLESAMQRVSVTINDELRDLGFNIPGSNNTDRLERLLQSAPSMIIQRLRNLGNNIPDINSNSNVNERHDLTKRSAAKSLKSLHTPKTEEIREKVKTQLELIHQRILAKTNTYNNAELTKDAADWHKAMIRVDHMTYAELKALLNGLHRSMAGSNHIENLNSEQLNQICCSLG